MQVNVKSVASNCCPSVARSVFERIKQSPTGLRLARGVFWSVAGTVVSRGLMLCATVVIARLLGRTAYGELGIIRSTVGMFGVFAGFGMGLTAIKYVAELRESDPERAGRIIALSSQFAALTGGVMALGLFFSASWLATHTIDAPQLAGALRIAALFLFISALTGAQTGALSGLEAFKAIARVNLFSGLVSLPVLVMMAYLGGLSGAVWGLTVSVAINWALNNRALRKESHRFGVPITARGCRNEWPILWRFSLPAVLAGAMVGPVNWACAAMLVNQPNGYAEMGVFNAADQWYTLLIFLPGVLGNVALPVLAGQLAEGNEKQSARTMLLAAKANLVIAVPLVAVASLLSPLLMGLYGDAFADGWPTLVIALHTAGVIAVLMPITQMIVASGQMWVTLAMNAGWAVVFLAGSAFFTRYGSQGLAAARGIAYLLQATWIFAFAYVRLYRPVGRCHVGSVP